MSVASLKSALMLPSTSADWLETCTTGIEPDHSS